MPNCFEQRIAPWVVWVLGSLTALTCAAGAPGALKVIDGPGGGHVVYGPTNEATPQAAMASALRYVHALIKAQPDRFQAVPTQDFLKGADF